jgi:hypothetical protein
MSIVAQGITFKVKLDVEGAKADQKVLAQEQTKTETAVRRTASASSGDRPKSLTDYISVGAGGVSPNLSAFLSQGANKALLRASLVGAVAAGGMWAVDKAFESWSPNLWAYAEGVSGGDQFAAMSRAAAEDNAKWVAGKRNQIASKWTAIDKMKDVIGSRAMLGAGPLSDVQFAQTFREQTILARSMADMEDKRARMQQQIVERGYGQSAEAMMTHRMRNVLNPW